MRSFIIILAFLLGNYSMFAQRQKSFEKERLRSSSYFEIDSLAWCTRVDHTFRPIGLKTNTRVTNDSTVLWIRLKADSDVLSILKDKGMQPAYIKWFRNTSAGMTPERMALEHNDLSSPKALPKKSNKKQLQNDTWARIELQMKTLNYFTFNLWTDPFMFQRPGIYMIRVVDFENNPIRYKKELFIRIQVEENEL